MDYEGVDKVILRIPSNSLEYIRVPVRATEDGTEVDPTGDDVFMTFTLTEDEPSDSDWQSAEWETNGSIYYARILVGPSSDAELDDGEWFVWVKVIDSPEEPVRRAGSVIVE